MFPSFKRMIPVINGREGFLICLTAKVPATFSKLTKVVKNHCKPNCETLQLSGVCLPNGLSCLPTAIQKSRSPLKRKLGGFFIRWMQAFDLEQLLRNFHLLTRSPPRQPNQRNRVFYLGLHCSSTRCSLFLNVLHLLGFAAGLGLEAGP